MISESIVKRAFMAQVFERDAKYIQGGQIRILQENVKGSGATLAAVSDGSYYSISGGMLSFRVVKTLRFLDMRRKVDGKLVKNSGLRVYNAIMWGVMYRRTMQSLRTGFTEDVAQAIVNRLRAAGGELQE